MTKKPRKQIYGVRVIDELIGMAIKYTSKGLEVLDQRLLPHEEKWLLCQTPEEMCEIIKNLQVRGAPLIGVAAALSLADFAQKDVSIEQIKNAAEKLNASRPTAVNLMAAMDRMVFQAKDISRETLMATAQGIFTEDVELCQSIGKNGADLIQDGDQILTHCNTGGLATAGIGTALGIIQKAHEQGKKIHVYVDETRPLLQGGRLTTWELKKLGIPYTLICDSMSATLMRQGKIQKVFVGADRIATNGDFANKIGTYNVAVLAKHHGVEFYVAAPYTTVDKDCQNGNEIPIENREDFEVRGVRGHFSGSFQEVGWAPQDAQTYNPAFDVTPADLVTGFVLDHGVFNKDNLVLRD